MFPFCEAFFAGFHRQRTQIAVGKGSKRRLPDPDYGYRSHNYQLIASRGLPRKGHNKTRNKPYDYHLATGAAEAR